jgi:3-oxoacyl-[acyl-carrier protein] reductase
LTDNQLEGRTALVTGASQGLGRAMALAFARSGANVVVTARSEAKLRALAAEAEALGVRTLVVPADLSIESDIDALAAAAIDAFGGVDILVNNAGIIHQSTPVAAFDPRLFRSVIDVNLIAAFLITKALLPGMMDRGYGKIINISSIGGRKGGAGRSAYRITKAGLISFTESLAAEVKQYGIDVNAICPGAVDTEGYREAFKGNGRPRHSKIGTPESIAQLALFLAGNESGAITGTAIDAFGEANPLFG